MNYYYLTEPKSLLYDIRWLRTVTTYAKQFSISRPAVYDLIKAGKVKSVKIDGTIYIYLKPGEFKCS